MYDKLWIKPTHDDRYIVVKDYYAIGVTVPEGYKTNGANIPRLFWSVIPPFRPKFMPAIVVHDYLCDQEQYLLADDILEYMLKSANAGLIGAIIVKAVRIYHYVKYGVKA